MTIGCNIWMICLKLNRLPYGLSRMLQFSQFVWALSYSVLVVFNNFLLIDATDRSEIRSDQKRFFIALSLYPLSFFANTPFKETIYPCKDFMYFSELSKFLFFFSLSCIYFLHFLHIVFYDYNKLIGQSFTEWTLVPIITL